MPFKQPLGASTTNQQPPHFIRPLQDKRATVGQKVVLECQVAGHPEPTVRWLKEGQNVTCCPDYAVRECMPVMQVEQLGNRHRLTIEKADMSDSGIFTCQALNAAGNKTTHATLIVALPPSPAPGYSNGSLTIQSPQPPPTPIGPSSPMFVKELKHQPLKLGGTAFFECRVVANPMPSIIWLKNGETIQSIYRYKIENDPESGICTLQISMMSAQDVGEYACQAVNSHGMATTVAQCLPKEQYDGWVSQEQTKITGEKKRTLQQGFDSASQQPQPKQRAPAEFYRPQAQFQRQTEALMETSNRPPVRNQTPASDMQWGLSETETEIEFGQYSYENSENISRATVQHVQSVSPMEMGAPPHIAAPLRDVQQNEGSDAILQCLITGSPQPRVQWFKNNQPVVPTHRHLIAFRDGIAALRLRMSFPEDSGEYTLVADNQFGRIKTSAKLEIHAQAAPVPVKAVRQVTLHTAPNQPSAPGEEDSPEHGPQVRAPTFLRVPNNLTVREGQVAKFDVKIAGRPFPTIEWHKDNVQLSDSQRYKLMVNQEGLHSLLINHVQLDDNGTYSCSATNAAGKKQCQFTLHVLPLKDNQMPQFVEKFPSVALSEGESAHLRCRATGTPPPTFAWSKDSVPLTAEQSPYRIETTANGDSTLYIENASPKDGGWFQCIATNSAGSATLRSRVSIQTKQQQSSQDTTLRTIYPHRALASPARKMPVEREVVTLRHIERPTYKQTENEQQEPCQAPRFESQPSDLTLRDGQSARFLARVSPANDPGLTVSWFFNGRPIAASSRTTWTYDFGFATLNLQYAHAEDSGVYTCIASNQYGEAQVSAKLIIEGQTAPVQISTQHPGSLSHIEALEHRHTGARPIELYDTISREPPVFKAHLKNVDVFEGKPAHFEAKLSPSGDPNLKVEWFHNGRPLQTGSRFRILNDFGFVAMDILYTIPEDNGTYTCIAVNPLGMAETSAQLMCRSQFNITSETAFVEPEDLEEIETATKLPKFITQLRNVSVAQGDRSHFEAKLVPQGDPFLKVDWYKDGQPLAQASRIQTQLDFGFVALTMNPTYPEDAGVYTAVATNRMGQAQTSAQLDCKGEAGIVLHSEYNERALPQIEHLEGHTVRIGPRPTDFPGEGQSLEPPVFVRQLQQSINASEGQLVHMECRLTPANDPKMVLAWFHNGNPLPSGHRFRPMYDFGYIALDILYAYPEDNGVYTIQASNALGYAQSQCSLVVAGKQGLLLDPLHPEGLQRIQELEAPRGPHAYELPDRVSAGPPQISATFANQRLALKEHQDLHLEARLEPVHDPTMRVEWFVNDRPLMTGSRVKTTSDFGYIGLDLTSAIAEDSGIYTIRASNAHGQAAASCQVFVQGHAGVESKTQHAESLQKIYDLESMNRFGKVELPEAGNKIAPVFVKPLPSTMATIAEGQHVRLECQVQPTNDTMLRIDWYRNGQSVPAGHRFRSFHEFGFVSLEILNMYPEDNGLYQCVATNPVGRAVTQIQLFCQGKQGIISQTHHPASIPRIAELEAPKQFVLDYEEPQTGPPQFTQHLRDVIDCKEGEFVHLECQLVPASDTTLTVQWYVNGQLLQTGHRFQTTHDFGYATVNILYVYPEDSGTYTCVARNSKGEAHTQCTVSCRGKKSMFLESQHPESLKRILDLEAPKAQPADRPDIEIEAPRFTTELQSLENLKEGQTAHMECQVLPANDPNLKIQWFHNGSPLGTGHRFRNIFDFGYCALDILYVYAEDSGTYVCRATNSLGTAETSATISCSSKRQILTDSQHPESWKKIRQMEESVPAAPEEQEIIKMKPVFVTQLNGPLELKEGQSAHLECQMQPTNDPNLKVEWFFNNLPLKQGHRFRTVHDFGYAALDILYAFAEDSGTYACRASNELGEAITTTKITCQAKRSLYLETQHAESLRKIEQMEQSAAPRPESPEKTFPKPQFTAPLNSFEQLMEGQTVHFESRLQPVGDPSLRVEWLKNGLPVGEGHRFRTSHDFDYVCCDILTVYAEDSGVYSCRATNRAGEAVISATLKCQRKSLHLQTYKRQA